MQRILVKTTILTTADDWSIGRFALLAQLLAEMRAARDGAHFEVVARDREEGPDGEDRDLAALPTSDFDQLWLFAVDEDAGLSAGDCRAITAFRQRGGGLLLARDHHDIGACVCNLPELGRAHKALPDDRDNPRISWPNYHSGRSSPTTTGIRRVARPRSSPRNRATGCPATPKRSPTPTPTRATSRSGWRKEG